jgi:hypothetical protein
MSRVTRIALIIALIVNGIPAFGYAQKVEVDLKDVDPRLRSGVVDAINKGKQQPSTVEKVVEKVVPTPESASKWVGVGKEVGAAVNASLGAVVDNAEKFGTTNVGRFTMFLVGWRLFGSEMMRSGIVLLLTLFGLGVIIYFYRRTCQPQRVLTKTDGKWFGAKEYKVEYAVAGDGDRQILSCIFLFAFLLVLLIGGCNAASFKAFP